ncbi:MAG: phosphopentomutase [Thermodesulfobacteriota bacterium]
MHLKTQRRGTPGKGIKRVVIIVFDGLGIGELPDAGEYGDEGSDTLDNTAAAAGGLSVPNLSAMGLGLIEGVDRIERVSPACACFGRMREASPGKDTATGHWEMSGVRLERALPTYPGGFPPEIMERFERETGYGYLWCRPASGTEILDRFGAEHLKTGKLIVYTSADSVFQIAAHEGLVPVEELYRVCEVTREFLNEFNIGRVIARPFVGEPGAFRRTERRRDYPIDPPGEFVIERIKALGLPVVGIGKIGDIFVHRGLTVETHTRDDNDGVDKTLEALDGYGEGLIFTNLVDFDTQYGHRNDPEGYARALERIDARIPEVVERLTASDMLVITADHGCDPTTPSMDHSREYVPLLVFGKGLSADVPLGTRATFSDLGQTLAEIFGTPPLSSGTSFLAAVTGRGG